MNGKQLNKEINLVSQFSQSEISNEMNGES